MDLEHLNKSQIVLLTLLVSFVTSIATGIVAVTLMQQAPPAITQTVNRIVERTVEKVVPQEGQSAAAAAATEKTIVVHESDQIADAVAKTKAVVVRLSAPGKDVYGAPITLALGFGVVASSDGLIFADASMISDSAQVSVLRSDGVTVSAKVVGRDEASGIVRLQAATTTDDKGTAKPITWTPAVFVKSAPNIGETVVVFGGKTSLKIANGIVTSLSDGAGGPRIIETSISADSYGVGSPLITASGEVLGVATTESRKADGGFLASPVVLSYNKPTEETKASP